LGDHEPRAQARAAYLAIALDFADAIRAEHPEQWARALSTLQKYPQVAQVLYHHSPVPAAEPLRERAKLAGLEAPAPQEEEWLWERTAAQSAADGTGSAPVPKSR